LNKTVYYYLDVYSSNVLILFNTLYFYYMKKLQ